MWYLTRACILGDNTVNAEDNVVDIGGDITQNSEVITDLSDEEVAVTKDANLDDTNDMNLLYNPIPDNLPVPRTVSGWRDWKQYDNRWKNVMMQGAISVWYYGCYVTAESIQIARSGIETVRGKQLNPGTYTEVLNENGGFVDGGLKVFTSADIATNKGFVRSGEVKETGSNNWINKSDNEKLQIISDKIQQGYYVIVGVNNPNTTAKNISNHWIPVNDVTDDFKNITIFDPGGTSTQFPAKTYQNFSYNLKNINSIVWYESKINGGTPIYKSDAPAFGGVKATLSGAQEISKSSVKKGEDIKIKHTFKNVGKGKMRERVMKTTIDNTLFDIVDGSIKVDGKAVSNKDVVKDNGKYIETPKADKNAGDSTTIEFTLKVKQDIDTKKEVETRLNGIGISNNNGFAKSTVTVVKTPEETKPSETVPSETKPEETTPSETVPSESKPEETKPSETVPSESKPEETKPSETVPSESKPDETKPSETVPSESETEETKPSETVTSESKSEETNPSETVTSESKPEETVSNENNSTSGTKDITESSTSGTRDTTDAPVRDGKQVSLNIYKGDIITKENKKDIVVKVKEKSDVLKYIIKDSDGNILKSEDLTGKNEYKIINEDLIAMSDGEKTFDYKLYRKGIVIEEDSIKFGINDITTKKEDGLTQKDTSSSDENNTKSVKQDKNNLPKTGNNVNGLGLILASIVGLGTSLVTLIRKR